VLMYLSISQLRGRLLHVGERWLPMLGALTVCVLCAWGLIQWLGPVYFWIPSVLLATLILTWAKL
jgi:hypothetical protein